MSAKWLNPFFQYGISELPLTLKQHFAVMWRVIVGDHSRLKNHFVNLFYSILEMDFYKMGEIVNKNINDFREGRQRIGLVHYFISTPIIVVIIVLALPALAAAFFIGMSLLFDSKSTKSAFGIIGGALLLPVALTLMTTGIAAYVARYMLGAMLAVFGSVVVLVNEVSRKFTPKAEEVNEQSIEMLYTYAQLSDHGVFISDDNFQRILQNKEEENKRSSVEYLLSLNASAEIEIANDSHNIITELKY